MDAWDEQFEEIRAEMRELYLRDDRPWMVMFSTGKDSTLVLTLAWSMLQSLAPEQRQKTIHVVCNDTKVEEPSFTKFVHQSLEQIQSTAAEANLPIEVHLGKPEIKNSFFYQIMGKGNTLPNGRSRWRWCTDKLKLRTSDLVVDRLLAETASYRTEIDRYDILMVLGVRESESSKRKQSIEKFTLYDKFAKDAKHDRVLVYHPIKYVEVEDLWSYLLTLGTFPWGIEATDLYEIYKGTSGECPMTTADGRQSKSCGGSRMGCWTCGIAGKNDRMLLNLIDGGDASLVPLLEFKRMMMDLSIDIRYRQPLRRRAEKELQKPAIEVNPFGQIPLFDDDHDESYDTFKRADTWQFTPGPIMLEGRRILLQELRYVEQISGHSLLEPEEYEAILDAWREDGLEPTEEDVLPKHFDYPGPIALSEKGEYRASQSTNPYPRFSVWEEFDMSMDDLVEFLREREIATRKSFHYFMTCTDYHRDFHMTKSDPIVNHVQFVVVEPNVTTQAEAEKLIYDWLFPEPHVEQMDWNSFKEKFFFSVMEYAESPICDPERLAYMNENLVALGLEPVTPPQFVEAMLMAG